MTNCSIFSTAGLSSSSQLAGWNHHLQQAFPGIVIEGEAPFRAETQSVNLGDTAVSRIRSQRANVRRWKDGDTIIRNGRAKIHIQIEGISTATQLGRTTALTRGEAALILTDEPYEMEISDRNEMLVFDFPLACLDSTAVAHGQVGQSHSPALRMLTDMATSLHHTPRCEPIPQNEAMAIDSAFKALFPIACTPSAANERASSDLRQQVFDFVDTNIADSALRTGLIADALGINKRDVQAIFAELATTPTAYVIERRLSLAAQRLVSMGRKPAMTDLALDLGFADAAHFCRRFKTRYGMTPGAYARSRSWH